MRTRHYGTSKEGHPSQPISRKTRGKVFQVQEIGGAKSRGFCAQEPKQSCISTRASTDRLGRLEEKLEAQRLSPKVFYTLFPSLGFILQAVGSH